MFRKRSEFLPLSPFLAPLPLLIQSVHLNLLLCGIYKSLTYSLVLHFNFMKDLSFTQMFLCKQFSESGCPLCSKFWRSSLKPVPFESSEFGVHEDEKSGENLWHHVMGDEIRQDLAVDRVPSGISDWHGCSIALMLLILLSKHSVASGLACVRA
jgi:hypothetical protein